MTSREPVDPSPGPDEQAADNLDGQVARRVDGAALGRFLCALPPRMSSVIVAALLERVAPSIEELARRAGCSRSTWYDRVARAKRIAFGDRPARLFGTGGGVDGLLAGAGGAPHPPGVGSSEARRPSECRPTGLRVITD